MVGLVVTIAVVECGVFSSSGMMQNTERTWTQSESCICDCAWKVFAWEFQQLREARQVTELTCISVLNSLTKTLVSGWDKDKIILNRLFHKTNQKRYQVDGLPSTHATRGKHF